MKSSPDGVAPNQTPTARLEAPSAYTDGDDAAELVAAYGYDLDPWQRDVLRAWLSRTEDDRLAVGNAGLSVPRQNGKNALLEARELYGLTTMNESILHTAHEVKTARKAFLRLCGFFENERQYPELVEQVRGIRRTNGQEGIDLWKRDPMTGAVLVGTPGGSIEFSARSRGAARGYTVDTVVFDEAQELTDEQVEALIPTLAAAPSGNRQYIYTGTPPSPGSPGTVFARERKTALHGEGRELKGRCWHEWGVSEIPPEGVGLDGLLRLAESVNPGWQYRFDPDFVASEAQTMSRDGFARERLGWWNEQAARFDPAILADDWNACGTDAPPSKDAMMGGKTAFGVKFDPQGDRAAIAVCLAPPAGLPFVELVDIYSMPGQLAALADWAIARLDKAAEIAVDGRSYASELARLLSQGGASKGQVRVATANEICAAAQMFAVKVADGEVAHISTGGQDALSASVTGCAKRRVGSAGAWAFGDGVERSCEAEAASLALYASQMTKRDPEGGLRIW